ncbi:MAG TPA: hypothetical protein VI381_07655 [Allosphingosinicella sp.]
MTEAEALAALGLNAGAGRAEVEAAYRAAVDRIQAKGPLDDAERAALFEVESAYRILIVRPDPTEAKGQPAPAPARKRFGGPVLYGLIAILLIGIAALFLWPKGGNQPAEAPVTATNDIADANMAMPLDEGPVTPLAPGTFVEWSAEKFPEPVTFKSGDITITVTAKKDGDFVAPELRISAPGLGEHVMTGEAAEAGYGHKIGVGRFNPAARTDQVLLTSYSGGAHCCTSIKVATPSGEGFVTADLGQWDGEGISAFPKDISGDSVADFVLYDNAFLYTFASYADSYAPPVVYNLVGTKFVDVSKAPAFRKLFAQDMARTRKACIAPENGGAANGACAAYVADAARVGKLPEAWAEMLNAYDPGFEWDLPPGCRVKKQPCPEGQEIALGSYPDALRSFLVRAGYIPANAALPSPPAVEPSEPAE